MKKISTLTLIGLLSLGASATHAVPPPPPPPTSPVLAAMQAEMQRAMSKLRLKGYEAQNWYAVAAPAGTPPAIVARLHDEIARFFTSPEMRKKMTDMGAFVDIRNADEMRKIIPAEIDKWTKVAIEAGIPRYKN